VLVVALAAAALAGCGRGIPDDPGPGPEAFRETEPPPLSFSPPPPQSGAPVDGCPTAAQVLDALAGAGTIEAGAPGLSVAGRPTCAGDWTAARVAGPKTEPLDAVLQTRKGRLYVVVAGSVVCGDPAAAGAPARVRAALGC
jgi:hypothetical protein